MQRNPRGASVRTVPIALLTLAAACSSGNAGNTGNGNGGAGSGGVATGSGGSTATGGTTTASGGSTSGDGTSNRGGSRGSGGNVSSGGNAASSGGNTTSGGGTTTGRGGSVASGGATTGGGGTSAGAGGAAPGTGGAGGSGASFTVDVKLSTAIPTVGIATWSLDAAIDDATIDFGRDEASFELQAPVDLGAESHRTLLLGMKQNTTYYVRVTAHGGGQTYVSQVASIKTGTLPAGPPIPTVVDHDASALFAKGGFTVTCTGYATTTGGGATPAWVFIYDRDGEVVWAYDLSQTVARQCTRARMSLAGKSMWANNFGNTTPDGALARIAMDGLGTPDAFNLPGSSHDFAILPDEHVVYFARDNGGSGMAPESIYELDPSTSASKLLYSEVTDFGDIFDTRGGHTNQVNYIPALSAISFSMYFINTIALVSYPAGKLLAVFGGDHSTFPGMSWSGQHGHDIYPDHLMIFNNNGTNGGASVRRFRYDLQAKTATEDPDYSSGLVSRALGDVKELPNGNYFVTYSTSGIMHEIDSSMKLLREMTTGASIAYAEHRATLYGPPPPYDR